VFFSEHKVSANEQLDKKRSQSGVSNKVDIREKWRSLFFGSKAPGLVFSTTYLRGKLAPSAVSGTQLYAGTPEFAPLLPAIL
jgi:hypothetical protein